MLAAFTARPIVELKQRDRSKIESILAYGDRLLVGLNNGSLRVYRINEVPRDEDEQQQQQQQEQQERLEQHVAAETGSPNSTRDNDTRGRSASVVSVPQSPPPKIKPTDLLREQEKFSRYKIEQLAIIKEAKLLISLSGGGD